MAEQDCGCTIARVIVHGEPRDQVRLCPRHTVAQEVRLALECVYTLSVHVPPGKAARHEPERPVPGTTS